MGRITEYHKHSYAGKNFDQHLYSIEKRLGKVVARDVPFTVIFVGETHNTIDERRRAALFGNRPSSPALLTVVERAMGASASGANLIAEAESTLSPFDSTRDDNVVAQIAKALSRPYKGILILFGEDHEKKFRERMVASPAFNGMIWHFYPSFHDHAVANNQVFPPYDPRGSGFELVGMIRQTDHYQIDLMQLAEGVMPKAPGITLTVLSPFKNPKPFTNYALFARPPLTAGILNGLDAKTNTQVQVSWDNLKNIRVLDIARNVRPLAADLMDEDRRQKLIQDFWADAT